MIENGAGRGGAGVRGSHRTGKAKRMIQMLAAGAMAVGVFGTGAHTALAYGTPLACSTPAQSTVFAPWGDFNTYFRISNGGFENGSTDWSLANGAAVVQGNEPYLVGGAFDSHSLRIPPNASAESRTMCVSVHQDVIRLFVNNQHVSGAILHVDAMAQSLTTGAWGYTAFDVNGDVPSVPWSPTIALTIPNMFGGNGQENLALRFTTRGTSAVWYIDDVYVDPFKSW